MQNPPPTIRQKLLMSLASTKAVGVVVSHLYQRQLRRAEEGPEFLQQSVLPLWLLTYIRLANIRRRLMSHLLGSTKE